MIYKRRLLWGSGIKNWFGVFLPLVFLWMLGLAFVGQSRIDDDTGRLLSDETAAVRLGAASLICDLAVTERHLISLTREKSTLAILDAPLPANLERLNDAFASLILRNPFYDQVSWIDETGMERARVNATDGNPVAIPQQELQSKATHDYFADTMRLKPGEIYLSTPGLNFEHGQIGQPSKLILRLATPVVDSTGKPRGILIIDLLLRRLFDSFIRTVDVAAPHMLLLNRQGDWLLNPNPDDEAQFMREAGIRFGQRFPVVWGRIGKQETGSFLADDGFWIWRHSSSAMLLSATKVTSQEPPWIVVSHVPADEIRAIKASVWGQLTPAALMGLAILATISWLMVTGKVRREAKLATVYGGGGLYLRLPVYLLAVVLPIVIVLLRQNLPTSFGADPLLLLFVFPITLCALLGGKKPGLIATALSALGSNYALLPPYGSFHISAPYDLFQWLLLIGNGVMLSLLSEGLRQARRDSEWRRLQQMEMMGQLQASETRFRQLAENSRDIFWVHDWRDGHVSYVSPAFETITGISTGDLYRDVQVWINAIHPDDREQALLGFHDGVEVGHFNLEYRFTHADGSIRWVEDKGNSIRDPEGQVYRVIGIVRDITDRKLLQNELEQYRHCLEALVAERTKELEMANQSLNQHSEELSDLYNNAPCGYHSLDADGLIVNINDTELAWLGYQREEVESRLNITQIITPKSVHIFREKYPQFKETGKIKEVEIELIRKDGSVLPVSMSASAVLDGNGNYQFSRSMLFDNSERKARDEQIRQLNAELARRAEEAEAATRAKSAFLANMSHEIRTPMNAVLGFCYILEQRYLEGEPLALIRKVHHAGRSLLFLINDILDFTKIEAGRLEIEAAPFRMTKLLDDLAFIIVASAHDKGLELIITPPIGIDELIGDHQRLQQVLVNLLGNAIKFTAQGEVELRVTVESVADEWVSLRFVIRDTGIGISCEQQALIFEAFSQADASINRRFGGTGLGLAISLQLVELMGGSLRVESKLGQGSEFWFELPFRCGQCVGQMPFQDSQLRLLGADENPAVRAALLAAANSLGWFADVVASGEAALMQALAGFDNKEFYDVLVFDSALPGLDGLDVAMAVREALNEMPLLFWKPPIVIIVTAYVFDELLNKPEMVWVDHVLGKPITPLALYNAVSETMAKRKQGLAAPPETGAALQRIPGVRVLVVDDSEINLDVAKGILEADGALVHLANDGQEAVEWLGSHPDAVDIVLMDVQMPRLDGLAAARRIRADVRWQNLPIVALTAGAYQHQRKAAEESGMNDIIVKPFNVEQMMALIQRWTGCRLKEATTGPVHGAQPYEASPLSQPVLEIAPEPPALPGVNLQAALRQWGQLETYRVYLEKFVAGYAQAGQAIAIYCQQGDLPAAASLAHKLCGVAGTLWLPQVTELARELETQLSAGEAAFELATNLQVAIDQVCTACIDWKDADGIGSGPEYAFTDCEGGELVGLFKGLLVALDHNDPDDAEIRLSLLREKLDDNQLAELEVLLTDFDFRGAKALLQALMVKLNISITE